MYAAQRKCDKWRHRMFQCVSPCDDASEAAVFPQPAFFVRVCLTVEMEEGVETLWREQGFAQGG